MTAPFELAGFFLVPFFGHTKKGTKEKNAVKGKFRPTEFFLACNLCFILLFLLAYLFQFYASYSFMLVDE
jgi:hypothetical protein